VQVRILSRCPLDPFRQYCPYCKGAGYFERWLPFPLVRYVVGDMSYIILNRRMILPSPAAHQKSSRSSTEGYHATPHAIVMASNNEASEVQVAFPH
jgi:hypothetical protein